MLVKTCGLQTVEAAQTAVDNNVDLLGVILVPNRSRTIDYSVAREISALAKQKRKSKQTDRFSLTEVTKRELSDPSSYYSNAQQKIIEKGPFLVGVFRNQSVEEVLSIVKETHIDIVQLHGSEDKLHYVQELGKHGIPVISRYLVDDLTNEQKTQEEILVAGQHLLVLLDSEKGGDGKTLNWDLINKVNEDGKTKFLLAGGLSCENVAEATTTVSGVIGVDVSSGIETNKVKDLAKIKKFIEFAK